jgi:hypothetical protein
MAQANSRPSAYASATASDGPTLAAGLAKIGAEQQARPEMTGLTAELVGHLEAMTADIAAPPPRDAMTAINGACASFLAGELGLVLRWLLERLGVESTLVKHKSLVTLQLLAENQAGLKFALAGSEEGKAKVRSLLEYEVADDPVMGGKPKLMVRDAVRTRKSVTGRVFHQC